MAGFFLLFLYFDIIGFLFLYHASTVQCKMQVFECRLFDRWIIATSLPVLSRVLQYSAMERFTVQCKEGLALHFSAVQCSAVQCIAVQCSNEHIYFELKCCAVQCNAVQCSVVQRNAVQCKAVQCSAVMHTVQSSAVQCSAVQGSVPRCATLP